MAKTSAGRIDIGDDIYDICSRHANILFSIRILHSELYKMYPMIVGRHDAKDQIISELKRLFREIEDEYRNIYRVILTRNGKHEEYIVWSDKTKDEILVNLSQLETYVTYISRTTGSVSVAAPPVSAVSMASQIDYEMVFPDIDQKLELPVEITRVERFKQQIESGDFSSVYSTTFYDGKLPIHMIIESEDIDYLNQIIMSTNCTFTSLTKDGQTCVDIAENLKNCKILRLILETQLTQLRQTKNELIKQLNNLKVIQSTHINKLAECELQIKKLDSTRLSRFINKLKTYVIIFLIFYFFFFS
jgi:hypothetical protein